ncbi:hypothetical protein C0Q88_07755 [Ralstonia pickettii]|uniref:Uncharacterized protein n=1 Tax=Ralstonia pickettii TaxID=329 RepID=A0A2N4TXZ5_RALPI|nr:hypothetical protein [Ralstonia pickettii]PLC44565.1 hypothetical protein C0Q88_07755 [Ralstonia pickettii]
MPLKRFWLMSNNINRLMAERDMRSLSVAGSAQSGEGFAEYRQQLILEIGTVLRDDPLSTERDQAGFEELRAMAAEQVAA